METRLLIAICSLLGAAIGGFFTYLAGKESKKTSELNKKLVKTKIELLQVYKDVSELLKVEDELIAKLNISKIKARAGHTISKNVCPKTVKNKIQQLQNQLI